MGSEIIKECKIHKIDYLSTECPVCHDLEKTMLMFSLGPPGGCGLDAYQTSIVGWSIAGMQYRIEELIGGEDE